MSSTQMDQGAFAYQKERLSTDGQLDYEESLEFAEIACGEISDSQGRQSLAGSNDGANGLRRRRRQDENDEESDMEVLSDQLRNVDDAHIKVESNAGQANQASGAANPTNVDGIKVKRKYKKRNFQSPAARLKKQLKEWNPNTTKFATIKQQQKKKYQPSGLRLGRWSLDEQQRFLLGLKKYGKDWGMIQKVVMTRDTAHVRSHAQKFNVRLTKVLGRHEVERLKQDAKNGIMPLSSAITDIGFPQNHHEPLNEEQLTNAKIYFQLLNQKMHKLYSKIYKMKKDVKQKEGKNVDDDSAAKEPELNCKYLNTEIDKDSSISEYLEEQVGPNTQPETRPQNTETVSLSGGIETEPNEIEQQESLFSGSEISNQEANDDDVYGGKNRDQEEYQNDNNKGNCSSQQIIQNDIFIQEKKQNIEQGPNQRIITHFIGEAQLSQPNPVTIDDIPDIDKSYPRLRQPMRIEFFEGIDNQFLIPKKQISEFTFGKQSQSELDQSDKKIEQSVAVPATLQTRTISPILAENQFILSSSKQQVNEQFINKQPPQNQNQQIKNQSVSQLIEITLSNLLKKRKQRKLENNEVELHKPKFIHNLQTIRCNKIEDGIQRQEYQVYNNLTQREQKFKEQQAASNERNNIIEQYNNNNNSNQRKPPIQQLFKIQKRQAQQSQIFGLQKVSMNNTISHQQNISLNTFDPNKIDKGTVNKRIMKQQIKSKQSFSGYDLKDLLNNHHFWKKKEN